MSELGEVVVHLGPRTALAPGGARSAEAPDGRVVAVFDVDGAAHAVDGRCLHRGGLLAGGYVRDGIVTCPEHWWRYDLRTGRVEGRPWMRLATYPVELVDGEMVVRLPALPPAPASLRERLLALARAGIGTEAGEPAAPADPVAGSETRDGSRTGRPA